MKDLNSSIYKDFQKNQAIDLCYIDFHSNQGAQDSLVHKIVWNGNLEINKAKMKFCEAVKIKQPMRYGRAKIVVR